VKFKTLLVLFLINCLLLTVFSYGFVDLNFPLKSPFFFNHNVFVQRTISTIIFAFLIVSLFSLYLKTLALVKIKKINFKQIKKLIFGVVLVLFLAWPAFSNDIFNYMATAKVTFFYQENPYLVMPIELPGEPMLEFMHAANKFALYAPFWIFLTALPHFLGFGYLVLAVFTFKGLVVGFYLLACWLVWKVSRKNLYSLAFFALNPLVIIETLISGHNDVVMMGLVLLAIWLMDQRRRVLGLTSLVFSAAIKYATLPLIPFYIFFNWFKIPKKRETFITGSVLIMLLVFLFISPIREEIYSWYFIWILALVALVPKRKLLIRVSLGFAFGLLLRYLPWFYFRNWGGVTPMIKTLVTFIPPGLMVGWQLFRDRRKVI